MTTPEDEPRPAGQDRPQEPAGEAGEVRIEDLDLGSAQPLEAAPRVVIGEDFAPEIVDLPEGSPSMVIEEGVIKLDKEALEAEMESVTDWLLKGVEDGDDTVLAVYLRNLYLQGSEDEVAELKQRLEEAFRTRDPSLLQLDQLDELHVNIVSAGIAERNLIREGLRPELSRQPFYFRDKDENILSGEQDLDIIIARDEAKNGGGIKIIVGSKRGIGAIVIPEEPERDKFKPDLANITTNTTKDVITVPLKRAADGTPPTAGFVEIHKGPIDLLRVLAQQDRDDEARWRRERQRAEEEAADRAAYRPPPPAPRAGGWSSSSG